MKDRKWNQYIFWGLTAFAVLAAVAGVVFLFLNFSKVAAMIEKIIGILKPVIYGMIMAYLMSPIYNRMRRYIESKMTKKGKKHKAADRLAKTGATLVSTVMLCAVAFGLVAMMLPELYKSVTNVINSLPQNLNHFQTWLTEMFSGDRAYQQDILAFYQELNVYVQNYITNTIQPNWVEIARQVSSDFAVGVMTLLRWFYDLAIGLIVMIYLLNIKEVLIPQFKKLIFTALPTEWAEKTVDELRYIHSIFGGFIIGKIIDSLIIGIMCFSILSLFNMLGVTHMPYTLLVSVIVGVTNVIPFFGPFIGAIPSTILIVLVDPFQGLIFVLFVFFLQQFDGNYLGPKILGDKTGISSFWVLFSILLFGGLFGFVGMIIAVPTWAVFMNLLGKVSALVLKKKNLPVDSEAYR